MAGLSLQMGMNGVAPVQTPTYNNAGTPSVMAAAFGPGATMPADTSKGRGLTPSSPVGMSVWIGIAAVVALVAIRQSLPQ